MKAICTITAMTILFVLGLVFGFIGGCYAIFSIGDFGLSTLATFTCLSACGVCFKLLGLVMDTVR